MSNKYRIIIRTSYKMGKEWEKACPSPLAPKLRYQIVKPGEKLPYGVAMNNLWLNVEFDTYEEALEAVKSDKYDLNGAYEKLKERFKTKTFPLATVLRFVLEGKVIINPKKYEKIGSIEKVEDNSRIKYYSIYNVSGDEIGRIEFEDDNYFSDKLVTKDRTYYVDTKDVWRLCMCMSPRADIFTVPYDEIYRVLDYDYEVRQYEYICNTNSRIHCNNLHIVNLGGTRDGFATTGRYKSL